MKKHLGIEQILQNIDYYWKTFLKKMFIWSKQNSNEISSCNVPNDSAQAISKFSQTYPAYA